MRRAPGIGAAGLLLCLLAAALAVSSLYVPGTALLLLALAASVSARLGRRYVHVSLLLAADSVQEGAPVAVRVRARGWPLALGGAQLRAAPTTPWQPIPRRGGGVELLVRPQRRGAVEVGPAEVRVADPLGISVARCSSPAGNLLVLPRVEPLRRGQLEQVLALAGGRGRSEDGAGVDGLRAYRPGAPASRIHWPTLARTGTLAERRLEPQPCGPHVLLVLDARSPAGERELDMAVRAAASLCVGLASLCGCSLLLPDGRPPHPLRADLASWPALHARLALVRAGQAPAWPSGETAHMIIWVHAATASPEPSVAFHCSVSPASADQGGAGLEIAGCAVVPAPAHRRRAA